MPLTIDIRDEASAALAELQRRCQADRLHPVIGRLAVNYLRDHFYSLDTARGNKMGGPRTHFYAQAARGTHFAAEPDRVVVGINQAGIAQRYFGGTITPGRPPFWITIPIRSESYGKRAREFDDLQFVPIDDLRALLVKKDTGKKGGKKLSGLAYYYLVRAVQQGPDPSVIPTTADIASELIRGIHSYLDSRIIKN